VPQYTKQSKIEQKRTFIDEYSKRNPWLSGRSKTTFAVNDPFLVFEQGNLFARADFKRLGCR
jgi:hypothetical protein